MPASGIVTFTYKYCRDDHSLIASFIYYGYERVFFILSASSSS